MRRDSIEEEGGVNLYAMVKNNPVNHWDNLGLVWYDWVPLVSPLVGLLSRYEGDTYTDYAHLAVWPSQCKKASAHEKDILEEECKRRMKNYAQAKFIESLGLNPGRFGEDVALTGIGGGLSTWGVKGISKAAAELLAKKALAKTAGFALVGIGAADIVLAVGNVIKQSIKFWDAEDQATIEYCDCCKY